MTVEANGRFANRKTAVCMLCGQEKFSATFVTNNYGRKINRGLEAYFKK